MEIDPFFAVTESIPGTKSPPKEKPPSSDSSTNPSSAIGASNNIDKASTGAGGAVTSGESQNEESAPSQKTSPPSFNTPKPTTSSSGGGTQAVSSSLADDANEELAILLHAKKITQNDVSCLQSVIRENVSLREKVTKLKSLLGRSAKAQRDTKTDLDATKTRLDGAQQEIARLNARVESLASRPTHMDLLADFETNFDRAVLSIGPAAVGGEDHQQSGEDPSGPPAQSSGSERGDIGLAGDMPSAQKGAVVSSMLLTELSEAKAQVERLESLNSALLHRASHLERTNETMVSEKNAVEAKLANTQLELRMARMETDNACREMREKAASLAEMQLEIDLVSRSAMDANARAMEGMEAAERVRTDKQYVTELEAKVLALQEWALASAESKRLTAERCHMLEEKVRQMTKEKESLEKDEEESGVGVTGGGKGDVNERRLWTKSSSLVVGAGLIGMHGLVLGDCLIAANETVMLRWKFDITPSDMDILFSIFKGRCDDQKKLKDMDLLIKDRHVQGGGGGEIGGAFAVQNACTLVWSNKNSWVRPRTIKFVVEAYAIQ
mmetsp:Transcript_13536/g.20193  ORF Transcript_13536/g.20193 Transcript_13536/m.20193 type:complete len:555 (-) Transcript_13536:163-1827(-)